MAEAIDDNAVRQASALRISFSLCREYTLAFLMVPLEFFN